jgi:hypothetical protein
MTADRSRQRQCARPCRGRRARPGGERKVSDSGEPHVRRGSPPHALRYTRVKRQKCPEDRRELLATRARSDANGERRRPATSDQHSDELLVAAPPAAFESPGLPWIRMPRAGSAGGLDAEKVQRPASITAERGQRPTQTRFAILTLAPHFIDTDGPICHPHRLSK